MPVFELQGSDGQWYDVEADTPEAAVSAFKKFQTPTPEEEVSTIGDVAKSAGVGLGKGVLGIVGLPGDMEKLGVAGYDWLTGNKREQPYQPGFPTSSYLQDQVEKVTGEFYEPQTTTGEWFQTAGEFAPSLLTGGTAALARGGVKAGMKQLGKDAVTDVALPVVGTEGLGQLTEGTAAEPYARLAGALVGGAAGAKTANKFDDAMRVRNLPAGVDPFKPTIDDIVARSNAVKAESQAAYKAVEDAGVMLNPADMKAAFGNVKTDILKATGLGSDTLLAKSMPHVKSNLDTLEEVSKTPVTLDGLDRLRQTIRDSIPANATAAEHANNKKLVAAIDAYATNLDPAKVLSANGPTQEASDALMRARELWGQGKTLEDKAKLLDNMYENALDAVGANYSVAGMQTALRQQYRRLNKQIRENEDIGKLFSDSEKEIVAGIVRGDAKEDLLRKLAKSAPNSLTDIAYKNAGPGAGAGLALGVDPVTAGAVGMGIGVGVGIPARRAAENLTQGRIDDLLMNIYHDGAVPLPPATKGLLQSLMKSGVAGTTDWRNQN